ncbi:MAG: ketopantoate reductase family protein, partial [Nitrososphaerales archaeon]
VSHNGTQGYFEVGRYPSGSDDTAELIVECLKKCGLRATVNPGVMKTKAAKCLINLLNAFQAITNTSEFGDFGIRTKEEAMSVWKAAGIEWEPLEQYLMRNRFEEESDNPTTTIDTHSSSWQSLSRKSGSIESGQLNGDVVALAELLGMSAPYNQCLWQVSTEMAKRNEKPGQYTLSDLERMILH